MRLIKKFLLLVVTVLSTTSAFGAAGGKPIVSILGDSYSTFEGYIPEGNAIWYYAKPRDGVTDVNNVRQTWWWQLINEGGYILGINDSYSGSTISYCGYRQEDYRDRSFITRLQRIVPSDILLIFGGTNDDWAGAPLGEFKYEDLRLGHLYEFRPALGKLLLEAQNRFPGTRILYIINSQLKEEITSSIIEICNKMGVEYVLLHDIEKQSNHPSVAGMAEIKRQVEAALKKK